MEQSGDAVLVAIQMMVVAQVMVEVLALAEIGVVRPLQTLACGPGDEASKFGTAVHQAQEAIGGSQAEAERVVPG